MANRPHNFNAGPAILPQTVLEEVRDSLLETRGSGLSILEWSHRGPDFDAVIDDAQSRLRKLLGLGSEYRILFLQGGASLQFAMVPMNLAQKDRPGAYIVTGVWAKKALAEAKLLGVGRSVWDGAGDNYGRIPKPSEWRPGCAGASYVHVTTNNTIWGTEWSDLPDTEGVPLVADMSSDILSRPMGVGRVSVIYAGAQKNLGPAGVTVVALREDCLQERAVVPTILDYRTHIKADGLYNTPNTFGVYLLGRVLAWVESVGGVEGMGKINAEKASTLYGEIDRTDFWHGTAAKDSRSLMNVTFRLASETLEKKFLDASKEAGFVGLEGHRSVGGCRASLYNALPLASVRALVDFMRDFERREG